MRIRLLVGATALCSVFALLGTAGTAGAARRPAHRPRLLATSPNVPSGMLLKPGVLVFDNSLEGRTTDYLWGPGESRGKFAHGPNVGIVWTRWGKRAAGRATYWIGYSEACLGCRYIRYEVTLSAWRIRRGHYTRLSITVPRGPVVYALERFRLPANGVPGGILAYRWCFAKQPKPCVAP